MRRMPLPVLLCFLLCVGAALDGGAGAAPMQRDAAVSRAEVKTVSPEDAEVVKNLDLLENLDQFNDLELLQELAVER